jgi:hypothetical protein
MKLYIGDSKKTAKRVSPVEALTFLFSNLSGWEVDTYDLDAGDHGLELSKKIVITKPEGEKLRVTGKQIDLSFSFNENENDGMPTSVKVWSTELSLKPDENQIAII